MAAFLPMALSAATSMGSAYLANQGAGRQSKIAQTKQKLVDQLLSSVSGNGPFSDLFQADDAAFQRSFVEPAKQRFQSQIAPQIQQSYIQTGMQGNTGLQDTLTRAGVDMNTILDQNYMNFIQNQQKNKMGILDSILGMGDGTPGPMSTTQALAQGAAGYLSSDAFQGEIKDIFGKKPQAAQAANPFTDQPRAGFASDWRQWGGAGIGDNRWGLR